MPTPSPSSARPPYGAPHRQHRRRPRVRANDDHYVVVDYKTNRLGSMDEPLTAWHYRPEALDGAIIDAHYPSKPLL